MEKTTAKLTSRPGLTSSPEVNTVETGLEARRRRDRERYKGERADRQRKTAADYRAAHRDEVVQKLRDRYCASLLFVTDEEERKQLRADPRQALRKGAVICLECFQIIRGMLNNAHLRRHGMTTAAYKTRWGYDQLQPLVSEQVAAKLRARIRRGGRRPEDSEVLSLTPEQWKICQQDPRQAIHDDIITRGGRFIACLECGILFRAIGSHVSTHGSTADSYRAKWGYDRGAALCSRAYSEKDSERARRRGWGSRLRSFRLGRGRVSLASGRAAGMRRGTDLRLQARLNRSEAQKGKARPAAWKRLPSGVVTDVRVAKLRLEGRTVDDIKRLTGLSPIAIHFRLRRMKFPPGRACVYDRGEPVTGVQMLALCNDFKQTRKQISALLGKPYNSIKHHTSPRHQHELLMVALARQVLTLRAALKQGYRTTAATAQGGRPSLVLPTEREQIPPKYRILRRELKLLHNWLKEQGAKIRMEDVWDWLCRLRRQEKIRMLFFWPEFLRWMAKNHEEEAFYNCVWLPSDVALEFLAAQYGASERTIRRIVTPDGAN